MLKMTPKFVKLCSGARSRSYLLSIVKPRCAATLSSEVVTAPELDKNVHEDIESNKIKPRKHPGVMKIGSCSLPENIVKAIKLVSEDHPLKSIFDDAKILSNYLFSRHYPWENEDLLERQKQFEEDITQNLGSLAQDATEEQIRHYRGLVNASVSHLMKKYNYNWTSLDFNEYSCMVYLFTRAAPNYAAVARVFNEIIKLCPDYRPKSLFDFGSGIGSVSWAAKQYWGNSIKEFMNIDSSSSMNGLAELILNGGKRESDPPVGVYYRMFLPAQHRPYSMVVSAHSLMELPSRDSRLNLLLNLWNKTGDFLIIIEQGTKSGFKVVVEARDFILSLNNEDSKKAHILSPCPHDGPCPRMLRGPYPCHFQIGYADLAVGKKETTKKELISYVIISKGKVKQENEWPRVVRPILKRHNHAICRLCTKYGDLREIIFTPNKHGKVLYKCAKTTNWGDLLPVRLSPLPEQISSNHQQNDQSDHQPKPD